jgi:hypothetical protein
MITKSKSEQSLKTTLKDYQSPICGGSGPSSILFTSLCPSLCLLGLPPLALQEPLELELELALTLTLMLSQVVE